jgi:hypothetical protein
MEFLHVSDDKVHIAFDVTLQPINSNNKIHNIRSHSVKILEKNVDWWVLHQQF